MQLSPENLLKALYDTLPDPVLVVDGNRQVVAANAAATEKFGFTREELVGMNAVGLYASSVDAEEMRNAVYPLSLKVDPIHRRLDLRRKDGSVFPAELTVSRLETADGEAIGSVALVRDLSEVYKARAKRLRAEAILNTALDAIAEGFVVYDDQDRLVLCNDAYREIYALSAPAIRIGNTFETVLRYGLEHGQYPDAGETVEEQDEWLRMRLERHNRPGDPFVQHLNPDRIMLVEERVTEQNFRVGVRTDITALNKIRSEAEQLGLIIEGVKQEVYLISVKNGRIISANKSARENLQYSMEELRNLNPLDLNVGHSPLEIAEKIAPIVSGETKVLVTETCHRRKDGSTYDCRVRLELMDETPEPVILSFAEDITERREIERALARKEHEFQTLVQNIPDFITRATPDTTLTYVNEHYARFVGLSADEMIGRKFLEFVPEQHKPLLIAHLSSLSEERPLKASEQAMVDSMGKHFWYQWSNLMVFEDGEPVELVSVGRDISEIREFQTRIADQSRELELRNDALEQFSGIVSHDLKAPLRQIRLFADMIAEDVSAGKTDELAQFSGYISDRVSSMERMISNLLEFSQLAYQQINPESFRLSEALAAAWDNLAVNVIEVKGRLELEADISVDGDRNLLTQMFQNLFANSLKYGRKGVAVVVRVHARTGPEGVKIIVEDNGIGIDPVQSERIFGVFQRLHVDEKLYSGTGIGLALCRRIAESHDGSIVLDTEYRNGARFVVSLPV
ncbi:PAS domain S-box protein [Hoeflea alexandrii]|uniref:histidine kinase n=1 Tax=Hoeflea alexandrii TaxID=288436 RepID=A0ABT1CRX1_9HYPH|nr:PAS domain S-box protein [Hoeflea alexandrii]MCO6408126.1 PAS domain S-box protein [Hoeflea alexandrii]